jgi:signal peptidase II
MASADRALPGGIAPWRLVVAIGAVVLVDIVTKAIAVERLAPAHVPHEVLGDFLRLTLSYNRGAAFGLNLGEWSRPGFIVLTFIAFAVLSSLYKSSAADARLRVIAIASVTAGATGNVLDRMRSARGVVDFIDIGIGAWRWPTFNVADMAVSFGAIALAVALWREDRAAEAAEGAAARADTENPAPRA